MELIIQQFKLKIGIKSIKKEILNVIKIFIELILKFKSKIILNSFAFLRL